MLLHTVDWWPKGFGVGGAEKRDRLGHLFPVAHVDEAARVMIAEQEWSLCRQLYDHVLYQQIRSQQLSPAAALGLSVANLRLIQPLWPVAEHGRIGAALSAITEYATGSKIPRRELQRLRGELAQRVRDWSPADGDRVGLAALQAVVALLRSAERAKGDSELARHGIRVLGAVEGAAVQAVPEGRPWLRPTAIGCARAEVWRSAFLYLELAVSGARVKESVL